jgi:hypothetical protein
VLFIAFFDKNIIKFALQKKFRGKAIRAKAPVSAAAFVFGLE